MFGIKPGAAGWEAKILPLCYAAPYEQRSMTMPKMKKLVLTLNLNATGLAIISICNFWRRNSSSLLFALIDHVVVVVLGHFFMKRFSSEKQSSPASTVHGASHNLPLEPKWLNLGWGKYDLFNVGNLKKTAANFEQVLTLLSFGPVVPND